MIEEQPIEVQGETIPVDTTKPNPNGHEYDHLYLDMNAIVHPCSHPEDRPAPETEEEMMLAIFEYTDRVVNMVRPRKLLMLAVGMSNWASKCCRPRAHLCYTVSVTTAFLETNDRKLLSHILTII